MIPNLAPLLREFEIRNVLLRALTVVATAPRRWRFRGRGRR